MQRQWTFLLTFLTLSIGFCNCRNLCNKSDTKCLCLPGYFETEIQCPNNLFEVGGYVIHIKEDRDVLIDCTEPEQIYENVNRVIDPNKPFNLTLLPNITIDDNSAFKIRFCPLPQRDFKSIFDRFKVNKVNTLTFESFKTKNITLNKTYFEGLTDLEALKLDDINLEYLDENTFVNTPKLVQLELIKTNVKLKSKIFDPTPLLDSVDISENQLETLPDDLFRNLTLLRNLHLWGNKLSEINEFTFNDLSNLESLELSLNRIANISEIAFKNLGNLKRISLSKNSLTTLPSNLFRYNVNLEKVVLNNNLNLVLPDYLFSNLTSLKEIYLENCRLQLVPEHIFEYSTNLKILKMNDNFLKRVPELLFKGLENLEELYLQNNKIESLANMLIFPKNLKKLHLEHNLIEAIEANDFMNLYNLQKVYLRKNRIFLIHYNAFNTLKELKIIDLSRNNISDSYGSPDDLNYAIFENVTATDINLSYNLITEVEAVINLQKAINLEKLDLRHNFIKSIMIKDFLNSRYPNVTNYPTQKLEVKLDWNNITVVNFDLADEVGPEEKLLDARHSNKVPNTVLSLANNPVKCDCRNYDLLRYFRNELSPKVKVLFEISEENLTCYDPYSPGNLTLKEFPLSFAICSLEEMYLDYTGCPNECFCYWRPFDKSIVVNCSNRNLAFLPNFVLPSTSLIHYDQSEMNFENNNLIRGPSPDLTGYDNVTKMILSNNKIKVISWLPPKLQMLQLHNNSLNNLSEDILNILERLNLSTLTLYNNPWTCNCHAEHLASFLRQRKQVDDTSHIYCPNSSVLLASLSKKDLCPANLSILYIIIPFLSVLLVSAILAALYYRYQQDLKVWLFANNLCLWWVTEEDLDKDKIYDAFISYSHKDEDFVNQNLLPVLEDKEGYKLCLHYRNWVPGEFIFKQVTNSVCDSRRTVVVLSPNFLESVWGKLEFRTAHTRAITEGRARVIILLYGDVDIDSLDNELKSYLKTNTYVKWGDPYFWNKLKYALPHSKKRSSNSQKHANVMNFIDDKFKLVTPVPASPGTTPPVLTLDPNLLKKHPLSFVPGPAMDTPPAEAGTLLTTVTSS